VGLHADWPGDESGWGDGLCECKTERGWTVYVVARGAGACKTLWVGEFPVRQESSV